ncbi:MAG TPA: cyclic lactone autoinducer peptide [Clostridiales bacterium]|nr:cyclic lactone autoinducer peptide [Clostridiales bacterium]
MNNKLMNAVKKVVDKNIRTEVNSRCICFGYQPYMPASAKEKFQREKK